MQLMKYLQLAILTLFAATTHNTFTHTESAKSAKQKSSRKTNKLFTDITVLTGLHYAKFGCDIMSSCTITYAHHNFVSVCIAPSLNISLARIHMFLGCSKHFKRTISFYALCSGAGIAIPITNTYNLYLSARYHAPATTRHKHKDDECSNGALYFMAGIGCGVRHRQYNAYCYVSL